MANLTRRRLITISAAAVAVSGRAFADVPTAHWRGISLGAGASITLAGFSQQQAKPLFTQVENELERLGNIFSLFRPMSTLSQLNRDGKVTLPPAELLEVLSISDTLNRQTGGAFDPAVQPLWKLYAGAVLQKTLPTQAEIAATLPSTGWDGVRFDADSVGFARPGMALTLNGIAQGYIADKVATHLRAAGLTDVLIDMGEIHAIGNRPDGSPWRAGIKNPDGGVYPTRVLLRNRALATSAPRATLLDEAGKVGHIFNPKNGQPGGLWRQASVSAENAALADGLSTAFCLMTRDQIDNACSSFRGVTVERLIL